MHRKSIRNKVIEVGGLILLSRFLGLAREMLTVRYLGAGIISDAFITAFKIPNSLRKIFSDGALSAAFIPTIVKVTKEEGKLSVSRIMSLSFLVFEGILLLLCAWIFWQAPLVIRIISPGWYSCPSTIVPVLSWYHRFFPSLHPCFVPALQVAYAIKFLRILISFIMFLSSSALLAGALQAAKHFFVPAFCQILVNISFIGGLIGGLLYGWPVEYLCYSIIFGGFLQFVLHAFVYFRLNFTFAAINKGAMYHFGHIMLKFFPCLLSMSVGEINLFISTSLATYLPAGSISLIYYANRFMGIPLGVFGVALSTILLPYFSHVSTYAPKRLSYLLFESAKLIFWITIPFTLVMSLLSEKIFITLFLSDKFTINQVVEAHYILIAFLVGLFFFSLNKILLNIYYSLHDTRITMLTSVIALIMNYTLSTFLLLPWLGAIGLALSFTLSGMVQSVILSFFLHQHFKVTLYFKHFIRFIIYCSLQYCVLGFSFLLLYKSNELLISKIFYSNTLTFFLNGIGFWFWMSPLCVLLAYVMLRTRKHFKIRLYFLE